MARDTIDVDKMFGKRASVSIEPEETPEEHAARVERERQEAKLERVKSYVLFFSVLIALFALGGLCAYEGIFDASATAETKRWAQTGLTALFTGSLSFILGQKTVRTK